MNDLSSIFFEVVHGEVGMMAIVFKVERVAMDTNIALMDCKEFPLTINFITNIPARCNLFLLLKEQHSQSRRTRYQY